MVVAITGTEGQQSLVPVRGHEGQLHACLPLGKLTLIGPPLLNTNNTLKGTLKIVPLLSQPLSVTPQAPPGFFQDVVHVLAT